MCNQASQELGKTEVDVEYGPPTKLVVPRAPGGGGFGFSFEQLRVLEDRSVNQARLSKRLSIGGDIPEEEELAGSPHPDVAMIRQTFVETVLDGSPAQLAGMQPGDQLLSLNEVALDTLEPPAVSALVAEAQVTGPLGVILRPIDYSKVHSTPTMKGPLVRKLLHQAGGRKASRQAWKQLHVELRLDSLCFFPTATVAATASKPADGMSIPVTGAICEVAERTSKRKHVFRLMAEDGSDCLLEADSATGMVAWVSAISTAATAASDRRSSASAQQTSADQSPTHGKGTGRTGADSPDARPTCEERPSSGNGRRKKRASFHRRSASDEGVAGRSASNTILRNRRGFSDSSGEKRQSMSFRRRLSLRLRSIGKSGKATAQPSSLELSVVEACTRFGSPVPPVLYRCIEEIERRGVEREGIYRLTGAHSQVQHLQRLFNREAGHDYIDMTDELAWDIHSLCGVVKKYIRNLKEPLLTAGGVYPKWIEASRLTDEEARFGRFRELLATLPVLHLATLRYLLQHLERVYQSADLNKMAGKNLAIVFGPTLVQPGPDAAEPSLGDMAHQCRVVEALLLHHRELLPPEVVHPTRAQAATTIVETITATAPEGTKTAAVSESNSSLSSTTATAAYQPGLKDPIFAASIAATTVETVYSYVTDSEEEEVFGFANKEGAVSVDDPVHGSSSRLMHTLPPQVPENSSLLSPDQLETLRVNAGLRGLGLASDSGRAGVSTDASTANMHGALLLTDDPDSARDSWTLPDESTLV